MSRHWELLREQALSRCQGYCEKCGRPVSDTFALHHRKLKSRGGKDAIDNLLVLHHECHNLGTNSVHLNVKEATEKGYMVPTHQDPSQYPVTLFNGLTVTLTVEGTYNYLEGNANGW